MKTSAIITKIKISNNLALHLLCVFCAIEAHEPKNVIHQMQNLFVEKKNSRESLLVHVHTPGKDCITARWAWQLSVGQY